MKFEKELINIEKSGDFSEIEFTLDESSKEFIMEMMSTQLYSSPKESLLRELVSNAVDAHTQIGQTKDVEVEYVEVNKLTGQFEAQLVIRDFGPGLSPEDFKNTYTKYFKSTKRDTNSQIGGIGIGCKSPLSYTDSFTVRTIHNKIDYTYVVAKSDSNGIKLFKLHEEPTELDNLTEIVVSLNTIYDKKDFENGIKRQLCYLKGIKYIGWSTDIKPIKIEYEDQDVVYSPDCPHVLTHIILGGVSYPIDWNLIKADALGINNSNRIGLKFNIGELKVSLNRETIYYTESTKKAICDKITSVQTKVFKELTDELKKETNFITLMQKLSQLRSSGYGLPVGRLENLSRFCIWQVGNKGVFDFEGIEVTSGYTFLKLFNTVEVSFDTYRGNVAYNNYYTEPTYYHSREVYYEEKGREVKKSKCIFKIGTIKGRAGIQKNAPFLLITAKTLDRVNFVSDKEFDSTIELQNKVKTLFKRDALDYDNYVVDESVFEDEEKKALFTKKELREQNKAIYAKILTVKDKQLRKEFVFTAFEPKAKEIKGLKGDVLIYGFSEDDDLLKNVGQVLYNSEKYKQDIFSISSSVNCRIIKIAIANEKYFKENTSAIHVKDWMKKGTDELIKFYTGYKINEVINRYEYLDYFKEFNSGMYSKYSQLLKYVEKYLSYGIDKQDGFVKNVLMYCDENKVQDDKVLKILTEVQEYCSDLGILKYIKAQSFGDLNKDQISCITDLLTIKNKAVTFKTPIKTVQEIAEIKGRAVVMQEFLTLVGLKKIDKANQWQHLGKNFYIYTKNSYLYNVRDWINTLPLAKLDLIKKDKKEIKDKVRDISQETDTKTEESEKVEEVLIEVEN